jgi:hypothetical protein
MKMMSTKDKSNIEQRGHHPINMDNKSSTVDKTSSSPQKSSMLSQHAVEDLKPAFDTTKKIDHRKEKNAVNFKTQSKTGQGPKNLSLVRVSNISKKSVSHKHEQTAHDDMKRAHHSEFHPSLGRKPLGN